LAGYLFGLTISAAGGTGVFGVSAGAAADSTAVSLMSLASAYTKNTSAWAVGSGNGSLDTGSIANGWYKVFEIQRPDTGVVDICTTLAANASPTFGSAIPVAYTLFRYIGSLLNAGGAWTAFTQNSGDYAWTAASAAASGTIANATPILVTLTGCPTGNKVKVKVAVNVTQSGGANNFITISSPDTGGQSASATNALLVENGGTSVGQGVGEFWTNTSGQVYIAGTGATSTPYTIGVLGWFDPRGQ
jgi:hypothetical protein